MIIPSILQMRNAEAKRDKLPMIIQTVSGEAEIQRQHAEQRQ